MYQENYTCESYLSSPDSPLTNLLGVLICDPLIHEDLPVGIYLRGNETMPVYSSQEAIRQSPYTKKHESMRALLRRTMVSYMPSGPDEFETMFFEAVLKQACDFCAAALRDLRIVSHLTNSIYAQMPRSTYRFMLKMLNQNGGRSGVLRFVQLSLQETKFIHKHRLPPSSQQLHALEAEICYLELLITGIVDRSENVLRFLEQKERLYEACEVVTLNKIALIFIPFSTTAAMASIQDIRHLTIFFALVLPVAVVVLIWCKHLPQASDGIPMSFNISKLLPRWFPALRQKPRSKSHNDLSDQSSERNGDLEAEGLFQWLCDISRLILIQILRILFTGRSPDSRIIMLLDSCRVWPTV